MAALVPANLDRSAAKEVGPPSTQGVASSLVDMWRIEAEVQTNDVAVKDLVLADIDRWRRRATVNVTTREEDPWKGTVSLQLSGSSALGVVARTSDAGQPAAVPDGAGGAPLQPRRFAAPSELSVEDLTAQVPFDVFLPYPPPGTEPRHVRLDPGDEATGHPTTASVVYVVMEHD